MRISLRWPTRPRSGPCSIRIRRRRKDGDSPAQAPRMEDHSPLRVVAIGGGNGLSSVLEGLKHYARPTGPATPVLDITAIVGYGDDGGDVQHGRRGAGGPGVVLQPFEDTGQAVTPADGDYAEWGVVFHARGLGRRVDIFTTPSFPDRAGPGAGPGGPAERNPHPGARSCGCAVPVQWRGGDSPGRWQDRPKVPGPAPAHSVYGRSREQWPTPSPGGCGLRRRCAR